MKYFYPILAALCLVFSSVSALHAQNATKLTDLNLGNPGLDLLDGVAVVNGTIYVHYGLTFGDTGNGPLARYDPGAGTLTPLFPEAVYGREALTFPQHGPLVFERNGITFARLRSENRGFELYRIDGDDVTLLHSNTSGEISDVVAYNDELYFLTANIPLPRNSTSNVYLAELWRTDGTPDGTQAAASLLSGANAQIFDLLPGPDGLYVAIWEGLTVSYYLYDEVADEIFLLSEGIGQYFTNSQSNSSTENQVVIWNGRLYTTDEDETNTFAPAVEVYDPITRVPVQIGLTNLLLGINDQDIISFYPAGDDLMYVTVSQDDSGMNVYRIDATAPLTLEPIFESALQSFGFVQPVSVLDVEEDGAYFTSSHPDGTAVYRYDATTATLDTIFTTSIQFEERVEQVIREDAIYVYVHGSQTLIQHDRQTGTTESFSVRPEFSGLVYTLFLAQGVLTESATGVLLPAFFDSGSGLVAWEDGRAAPELLLDHPLRPGSRITPLGADRAGNYYFTAENNDRFQVVAGTNDIVSINGATPAEVLRFTSGSIDFPNGLVVLARDTNSFNRAYRLEDGTYLPLTVSLEGTTVTDYNFSYVDRAPFTSESGYRFLIFENRDTGAERVIVRATLSTDNTLIVEPTTITSITTFNSSAVYDGAGYFEGIPGNGDESSYTYIGLEDGRTLTFSAVTGQRLLGVSASGIFVRGVETVEFFPRSTISYYPFDESAPVVFSFDEEITVQPFSTAGAAVIGERAIFLAFGIDVGLEYFVADATTGRISLLADIKPGFGSSVVNLDPSPLTSGIVTEDAYYFAANNGTDGTELYVTDGTTAGTRRVADINPGEASSFPTEFTRFGDEVLFRANGPDGFELYNLNLDTEEVSLKLDLNPGTAWGLPMSFDRVGQALYLLGRNDIGETFELYRVNEDIVFSTEAEQTLLPAVVYPNPVGTAPVTIQAPDGERMVRTELFDVKGSHLRTVALMGTSGTLNLSELPAGQYFLRTWYASGKYSVNGIQRVR